MLVLDMHICTFAASGGLQLTREMNASTEETEAKENNWPFKDIIIVAKRERSRRHD
jgi:hypothetical protein